MKCPSCQTDINLSVEQSDYCPNCHYVFNEDISEKLVLLKQMKSSITKLDLLKQNFSIQLEDLQNQAVNFERVISNDLSDSATVTKKAKREIVINKNVPLTNNENIPVEQIPVAGNVTPPIPPKKKNPINWEIIFGFNGFLILGVISVLTGVGFFIRKAFVSGLLGPVGKVSIIYLGAVVSLGIGNFFRKKHFPEFGQGLIGMGIALLYYATYSGFQNYGLFNQYIAFFLMILITTFATFIAVLDNNRWLAVLGLIGGFSTPIMLSTGESQNLVLYTYITILNGGLLAIAFKKKWAILNNLGFLSTYLLFSLTFNYKDLWTSMIFLNIFFFIYSLVPFAYHIFQEKKENIANTFIVFANTFVALVLNYRILDGNNYPVEYLSIITILYTLNFIAMANYLYKKGRKNEQTFVFTIAQAALLLSITIPIIFSKEVITLFWFAEAAILMWISDRVKSKKLVSASIVVLLIALGKFFCIDYDENFNLANMHFEPEYTFKIIPRYIVSIFLIGSFYKLIDIFRKTEDINYKKEINLGLHVMWVLSIFSISNIEVSAAFYNYFPNGRFVAISVLWAIFAISLMYAGLRINQKLVRHAAIGLFIATMIKVFFVDIAELSISYKFISFIVLGIILIFTSYLYRKFKDQIIEHIQDNHNETNEKI